MEPGRNPLYFDENYIMKEIDKYPHPKRVMSERTNRRVKFQNDALGEEDGMYHIPSTNSIFTNLTKLFHGTFDLR